MKTKFSHNGWIIISMTCCNSQPCKKAVEEKWWQPVAFKMVFRSPRSFAITKCWLWRQNFLTMDGLSFQWHVATLNHVRRLWKRNGGNQWPSRWFLGARGVLLFTKSWLWRQNFFTMAGLSSQWHVATLNHVRRLWKRKGGNQWPLRWFLGARGVLLFTKSWLWRQNFLAMDGLSFQWHVATPNHVRRLWKRNGGNQWPLRWFLGARGVLLFTKIWLWRQNFLTMDGLSFQWHVATLNHVRRLWKRKGGNQWPLRCFLGARGVLLFTKSWLWRQNFLTMDGLSFQWHVATLNHVRRLWKRNGGNQWPLRWFLGARGVLLFTKSWLWRQNFLTMDELLFQGHAATLKHVRRLWKRNGGNQWPLRWFSGARGVLLFTKSWLWRQNSLTTVGLSF